MSKRLLVADLGSEDVDGGPDPAIAVYDPSAPSLLATEPLKEGIELVGCACGGTCGCGSSDNAPAPLKVDALSFGSEASTAATVQTGPAGGSTVEAVYGGTVGDSGNVMLEGLIWGLKWDNSQPITYYFDDAGSTAAWTATEKAAFRDALKTWSDVANISFQEVFTIGEANFVERKVFNTSQGSLGQHEVPNSGNVSVGQYNPNGYGWDAAGLQPGGLGFATLVHELGHALGLAHPHDTGGGSTVFPGVTSPFGSYGDNGLNQNIYTIMSYNHGYESAQGSLPTFNYGDAATPMPLDIAAMQFIYGARAGTNSGDNTYTLPGSNAAGTAWRGIYDTGGTDQIVYTGSTSATINLQSAFIDNVAGGGGSPSFVSGIYGGFTIAQSATIENATAGSGDDTVVGNRVANVLHAGEGSDIVAGGGNNDFIFGEGGNDTLYGDAANSTSSGVGLGAGLVTARGTSIATAVDLTNTFSLSSDANIVSSTTIPHTTARFSTGVSAVASSYYAVTVTAGSTITLDIDATTGGLDSVVGILNAAGTVLTSNDDAAGDPGSTGTVDSGLTFTASASGTYYITVAQYSSFTTLPANASYDLNVSVSPPAVIGTDGTAGSDTLDGGTGTDTMVGGDGGDFYVVDATTDVVTETNADVVTGGFDYVTSSANYTLTDNVEELILVGGATTGTGSAGDNVLYGLSSGLALTLNGKGGNDVIYGSAVGGNTLTGEAGVDTMLMYGGNNTANGGTGSDIYYTYVASDVISEAGGDGIDTVYSAHSLTVAEDVEQVILFTTSATSATSSSADDNNIMYGNSTGASVTLNGGGGADVLFGGSFADALNGGAGVDLLFGNGGADALAGGDDTDVYYLTSGTETITETISGGFDTAYSSAAGTTVIGTNVEQLILYGAATGGTGNGDANYLYGHIASNAVTLDGAGGADYLLDSAFSGDILIGGAGNDTLDIRTGGNDFIRYAAAGSNADSVFGFDAEATGGQDLIDVSGRGFSAASIGGAIVIATSGADTLVTIGTDTITFVGVSSANVTSADFLF